jgi:uncharacterized membrane protein
MIAFDDPKEARKVRHTLSSIQDTGPLSLDDSAIMVKDKNSKVHLKNEYDLGVKVSALGDSAIVLRIGSIFFPIDGLILGAIGRVLVGKLADIGVSQNLFKEASEEQKTSSSAIFYIVRGNNPNPTVVALREYQGKALQTCLPDEAEETLRKELEARSWEELILENTFQIESIITKPRIFQNLV